MTWELAAPSMDPVRAAWAAMAGVERLQRLQVVARDGTPLSARGWIGILVLDGTVTVVTPSDELADLVRAALGGVDVEGIADPEVVVPLLPVDAAVRGPAALFYGTVSAPTRRTRVRRVDRAALAPLLDRASADDVDECGLGEIDSDAFVVFGDDERPLAAAGYRRWPGGLAHASVLTDAAHRGRGLGAAVGGAALRFAQEEESLLPQWRAMPSASKAVARRIGLVERGAQLSLCPL
jgi:GNAT superfamily N-acetyltransferase